jgi:Domain of unknown function (DUF2017)
LSAPIKRRRDGRYAIKLDEDIRTVLAELAKQMIPAVESRDPMTRRLFPPAYPGESLSDVEADYRELVDVPLTNHHREALTVLADTAHADTLSQSELDAWLSAVSTMRLVLGTRLDVTEDMPAPAPDDPSAAEYGFFEFLGQLQFLIVEVLADHLPDEGFPGGPL